MIGVLPLPGTHLLRTLIANVRANTPAHKLGYLLFATSSPLRAVIGARIKKVVYDNGLELAHRK